VPDAREINEAVQHALKQWNEKRSTDRLWSKDASLWPPGAAPWLGWLDAATAPAAALYGIERRAGAVAAHASDVLLMGMGGSSLAPEVIANTLPAGIRGRRIRVLDSTEPAYIRRAFSETDWARTVMLVASKSGSTLEPDILLRAALAEAERSLGDKAGKQCIAITDPGSALEKQARELGFAEVFHGEPSIGGRFSALSPFGLVPAALHGLSLGEFVSSAHDMVRRCHDSGAENPGASLGVYLGVAAMSGRDKCTLILPDSLASMGAWIEQLVAESTGKNGLAIIPVDGEALSGPGVYGSDRAFVHIRDTSGPNPNADAIAALEAAGHPVFEIAVPGADALAGEFFRWEFATAVAGSILGLNPFDQPDVEASKVATRALTDAYERGESPPPAESGTDEDLSSLIDEIRPGDYFAILAFLPMFGNVREVLARLRMRVRDAKRVATTLGFGPRFLHSTGQAFKGGPNTGVFLQLTCDAHDDMPVPGRKLTFGSVVSAQAAGDRAVLRERGRRLVHIHLKGDLEAALAKLDALVASRLGG
jgi:transaldolase/glucose-6-phosphate isomerase